MIGKAALGVFLFKAFLASGYFAFFYNRPKRVKVTLLEDAHQDFATQFNEFVAKYPDDKLNQLVDDLNWIIRNNYKKDIRVKRVIHQDLKGLVAIANLREKLERPDTETSLAYDEALETISERVSHLRNVKDKTLRDQILMLGEIIKGNDR